MNDAQLQQLWKCFPDTFAQRASGGRWQAYPWIQYLSSRITPKLVTGGGRFLAIWRRHLAVGSPLPAMRLRYS